MSSIKKISISEEYIIHRERCDKMAEKFPELIEAGLNKSQRRFCKIGDNKNIRLLAPAGSGKTFSLLWRCKCIHEEYIAAGKPAPNFLIITFTRTARFELEDRIGNNENFNSLKMTVSTLNAWGWEFMKNRSGKELITGKFNRRGLITHDLLSVCKKYEHIAELIKNARGQAINAPIMMNLIDQLKGLGFSHLMKKREFKSHIKYLKGIGLDQLWNDVVGTLLKMEKINLSDKKQCDDAIWEFFCFWKDAVCQLEKNNRFTLEDQKYWPRIQLEERISEGKYASNGVPYTHIFVDEFQDINPLDLVLIQAISKYHGKGKPISVTIVGDDDQAIFGWRGTTPQYILYPEKYFEQKFVTCVLDTNYRSPKKIVEASANLIHYNKERVEKEMKSAAKGRALIKVVSKKKTFSTIEQTIKLAHELIEDKGCKNVALIARKQGALFPYQVMFSAEGTEYNVAADLDIFEGEAMKSLQAIIQIIYRAKDNDSDHPIEDLITVCDKVERFQIQNKEKNDFRNYLEKKDVDTFEEALDALRDYPKNIKNQSTEILYYAIRNLFEASTVESFMEQILENFKGFEQNYMKADDDVHYKNPQFVRLKEIAVKYDADFRKFYRDIDKARRNGERSRKRDTDTTSEGYNENQEIKIHLLTATRSKGKEFDAVIIVDADMEEWPNPLSNDIEEERRLFYVAMTRAKQYLYFMVSGQNTPSRFLLEAKLI